MTVKKQVEWVLVGKYNGYWWASTMGIGGQVEWVLVGKYNGCWWASTMGIGGPLRKRLI